MTPTAALVVAFVLAFVVGFVVARLALEVRTLRAIVEAEARELLELRGQAAGLEADAGDAEACTHQPEHRTNTSTSGVYRWRCDPFKGGCGFVLERPATTGDFR